MRNLLSIAITLICSVHYTQTTILSENFNSGFPAGWQLIDNDGGTPYNNPSVNFITEAFVLHEDYDSLSTGDSILIATSWLDPIIDADDYLILPPVTLGSWGNYLYFDAKSVDQSYPDGIQIRFTTGNLSVDSILAGGILFDTLAAPPYWTNFSVRLDTLGLQNQTVNFVIRHYASDQFILAIDNIRIDINDPSNVVNNPSNLYSIFPNPCENVFYIDGLTEKKEYQIFNLQGKLVQNGATINSIELDLAKGIYILKVEGFSTMLRVQ